MLFTVTCNLTMTILHGVETMYWFPSGLYCRTL